MYRPLHLTGLLMMSAAAVILSLACQATSRADEAIPTEPPLRWWKGNIHTHSLWSDGDDFPEMIAEWYRTNDYNFLALSDHNVLSEGQRWMSSAAILKRGGKDVLNKYQQRFGGGWVETRGTQGEADHQVRLKPLNEFRTLVEERGRFLMIQGEEISDKAEGKPVHMNATNVKEALPPVGGKTVREVIENNFRAAHEHSHRTGREMLVHLNHPNFGLAVTAEDLAAVVAERFFEVYNGHPGVKHLGDHDHPSVERLWDIANTLRLDQLHSAPLFGVATDDSHKYHGPQGSRPGRGWIMVHCRYLSPEHLIRAIKRGDFYASSGVTLAKIDYDAQKKTLRLEVEPQDGASYTTQFIGTLQEFDRTAEPREGSSRRYSSDVGKVLAQATGPSAEYRLSGKELYVRAVVTSSLAHTDPSFEDQKQQAWTQPVGWTIAE